MPENLSKGRTRHPLPSVEQILVVLSEAEDEMTCHDIAEIAAPDLVAWALVGDLLRNLCVSELVSERWRPSSGIFGNIVYRLTAMGWDEVARLRKKEP